MRLPPAALFATLAGVVTLAGIVAGFAVIGPPSETRMRRFDEMRVGDLVAISDAIAAYRRVHGSLPQTLDDLPQSSDVYHGFGMTVSFKDPEERPYEYMAKDEFSYELCAEFDRPADQIKEIRPSHPIFSKHRQGRQCFSLEARPPAQR